MRPASTLLRARARTSIVGGGGVGDVPQERSYAVAGGLFVALLGVVGIGAVYLPYYSKEAIENRERTAMRRRTTAEDAARASVGLAAPGGDDEAPAKPAAPAPPAAVVDKAKSMPFTAGLARDNAPGSMWRSISSAREIKEAQSAAAAGERR